MASSQLTSRPSNLKDELGSLLHRLDDVRKSKQLDLLMLLYRPNVVFASRFHPYIFTHGIEIIVFSDGTSVLFVNNVRARAKEEQEAGKLQPGLRVVVYEGMTGLTRRQAIYNELKQRPNYAAYHEALDRLVASPKNQADALRSLKIGIDEDDIAGKQMKATRALFPDAEFVDCTKAGSWSLSVLDSHAVKNQIIAAELAQVIYCRVRRAIDQGLIATKAKIGADTAMQLYQQEYFPEVDLAGMPAMDSVALHGWSTTIVFGNCGRYQKTEPRAAKVGETWTLYIIGYVNGISLEFSYTGGTGLPKDQANALDVMLDMHEQACKRFGRNIRRNEIYNKTKEHLDTLGQGHQLADHRIGHGIGPEFHFVGDLHPTDNTIVQLGSSSSYEPILKGIAGKPDIQLATVYGRTHVMMDHGWQPLTSFDLKPVPIKNAWTIEGKPVAPPNLARAAAWEIDFGMFEKISKINTAYLERGGT